MENQQEQRKLNKHEMKKQQQYQERRQRLINQGISADQVDLQIAKEDYNSLPLDKKVKRLENIVQGLAAGISQDINSLATNDRVMADIYDINIRCIKKLLVKMGLDPSEFETTIHETEEEWQKEQAELMKAKKDIQEKEQLEAALGANDSEEDGSIEEPAHDGATSFGG